MDERISKAQIEVWEWKKALHEEVKDMELEKGLDHLLKKSEEIARQLEDSGELVRRVIHGTNA